MITDPRFIALNREAELAKLVWLVDECIARGGSFPSDSDLRVLGHNILALLGKASAIRSNRPGSQSSISKNSHSTLASDNITSLIMEFLSEFAQATRYFN